MIRLYNARILSMNDREIMNGEVWVNDGKISYVGSKREDGVIADEEIDCEGNLLMPSFKNMHTHTAMTFSRSISDNLPLQRWLFELIFPMEAELNSEDVYWFGLLGLMEYLASGVSSCFDMYFFADSLIEAAKKAGVRVTFCGTCTGINDVPKMEQDYLRINSLGGLFNYKMGFHAEYTNDIDALKAISNLAHKYKAPVYSHNQETKKETKECIDKYGKTPTQLFDELGLFDYGGGGFHCVHFEDKDFEIFKKRGLTAVINSCSNAKLASGIADLRKFNEYGINITLGTDGAGSNNSLDMFKEMYLASVLQNIKYDDAAGIDPFFILKAATSNANDIIGVQADSLSVGKAADIIMIDLSKPSMNPLSNIANNLVYSGSAQVVKMTMVDGKIRYMNGEFIGIDKNEVIMNCNSRIQRLKDIINA